MDEVGLEKEYNYNYVNETEPAAAAASPAEQGVRILGDINV